MLLYWNLAALLSAFVVVYLWAEGANKKPVAYFCKPAATVTVIVALWLFAGFDSWFLQLVLLALLASMAGDVFLMLPNDRFIPGLASFFIAHLAYVFAFLDGDTRVVVDALWLFPLAFAALLLSYLWTSLAALKIPVVLYATVIMVMLISTIERYQAVPNFSSLLLLVGAIMFVLSDALIALDKFKGGADEPSERGIDNIIKDNAHLALPLIIVTYYIAQWLLVSGAIFTTVALE